jgi:hypothetical protein
VAWHCSQWTHSHEALRTSTLTPFVGRAWLSPHVAEKWRQLRGPTDSRVRHYGKWVRLQTRAVICSRPSIFMSPVKTLITG